MKDSKAPLLRTCTIVKRSGVRVQVPESADVVAAELLEVIGRNGSGKTTVLRSIAGLSVGHESPPRNRHLRVAYVPAGVPAVRLPFRRFAEFRKRAASLNEALDLLGFEHHAKATRFGQLSFGNARKLLIAEALTSQCDIVCIDELFQGLDSGGERGTEILVRASMARGVAVVVGGPTRMFAMVEGRVLNLGQASPGSLPNGQCRLSFVGPTDRSEEFRLYAERLGFRSQ